MRVRYTNGGTGQATFRLATILKRNAVSMTYEQLSSNIDDSHDAGLVRSVLAAKKPNDDYTNIQATAGGNLKVSIEEQNGTANLALETGGNLATIATNTAKQTTIINGKTTVTTAGTAVALAASTACWYVFIKALSTNTGIIYVGDSSVSSANGYPLSADEAIALAVSNLSTIYIDSSVNGESVNYLGAS